MLNKLKKQNKISPRSYDKKRHELEVWVNKEEEEVKKTKKVFDQERHKPAKMISQS